MHRSGFELAIFQSRVRHPNHYTTESTKILLIARILTFLRVTLCSHVLSGPFASNPSDATVPIHNDILVWKSLNTENTMCEATTENNTDIYRKYVYVHVKQQYQRKTTTMYS